MFYAADKSKRKCVAKKNEKGMNTYTKQERELEEKIKYAGWQKLV